MTRRPLLLVLLGIGAAITLAAVLLRFRYMSSGEVSQFSGAVLRSSADHHEQSAIAGAQVVATSGISTASGISDSSGLFHLRFAHPARAGEKVALKFTHTDYMPLDMNVPAGDRLLVIRMLPVPAQPRNKDARPAATVSNLRVRYAAKTTTTENVGSTVKSFDIVNTGDVPCNGKPPCSPDGKWKAAIGAISLDAGEGNEFHNVRVSCIAGPCPFTRIESDNFSRGGRHVSVSVRNWSDTATFVLEAEVFRTMASDRIRQSFPVIFDQAMSFTLPPEAAGPSIEAELDGTDIVFPLGPNLYLSWATCSLAVTRDRTKSYHCELKPGYTFR